MAATYTQRTVKEFEDFLSEVSRGDYRDLTDHYHEHKGSWEHVYCLNSSHPRVRFLIFSSVDIRTGSFRDCGNDMVRVDLWVRSDKGINKFKHWSKHPRIDTLFKNLRKSIKKGNEYVTENNSEKIRKWIWAIDKNS